MSRRSEAVAKDPHHCCHAWRDLYDAFGRNTEIGQLSLLTGFYMGSFGMMRGSSRLRDRHHSIHQPAIQAIKVSGLPRGALLERNMLPTLATLTRTLTEIYKDQGVTPTDTLVTKLLLGTLAILPGYDRFVVRAARMRGVFVPSLSDRGLQSLISFVDSNRLEIEEASYTWGYPPMRVIDIHLFEEGIPQGSA